MTTASNPAFFSSGPHHPPASDSPYAPVSGDLAATVNREAPESGVPVITLAVNTKILSGLRGSTPAGSSLRRKCRANPLPPK